MTLPFPVHRQKVSAILVPDGLMKQDAKIDPEEKSNEYLTGYFTNVL